MPDVLDAVNFVINSKVNNEVIRENVTLNGKKLPQRFIFVRLKKFVRDFFKGNTLEPRMIGIAGIRGVGKTTLLWQIADYVSGNFQNVEIYFVNVDVAVDYGFKNTQIIEAFDKIIKRDRGYLVLLDEVQYMRNWSLMLKILYDKFKNIFVIVTGSSSLILHSNVDLSTRWNVESLYPLSFPEFVLIRSWLKTKGEKPVYPEKGIGSRLKEILFYSQTAGELWENLQKLELNDIRKYFRKISIIQSKNRKVFFTNMVKEYVFYHNIPRLLFIDERRAIIDRVFDMLHRVVYQDLKEFYEANEIEKIKRFLVYLAFTEELNENKIAQSVEIKKDKLRVIIDSLENSEIIIRFPPYAGIKSKIKKFQKLFFVSPTIRYAILKQILADAERFHSKLYEDIVALYLKRALKEGVYYGKLEKGKSPDFVIEIAGLPCIPLEVGSGKKDLSQLDMKCAKYGLLIIERAKRASIKGKHVIVPLKWFLLM